MKFRRAIPFALLALGLGVFAGEAARAQQANPAPAAGQADNPGAAAAPRAQYSHEPAGAREQLKFGADYQLASWLIVDNQGEIALAQIALQKSQNDQVKQFAQQMLNDHQKMLTTLQKFASAEGSQPAAPAAATPPAGAATNNGATPPTVSTTHGAGFDLVSLKRELGEQCRQAAQKELDGKQGAEFDQCFMGMQLAAHMEAVDTLTVFRNHASGALRQTIDEALPTVQGHLQHAQSVMKQLAGSGSTSARAGEPAKR